MHVVEHEKPKVHVSWYNDDDHETVHVVKVNTIKFPVGARALMRVNLLLPICAERAWNVTARYMAYVNGICVLKTL